MTEERLKIKAEITTIGNMNLWNMSKEEILDLLEKECNLDEYNLTSICVERGHERRIINL